MQLLIRSFIYRIIFSGAGFLVSLLIAKLAGASQFGVLSLIIVNAAFIHILTGLGTDAAIVWHGANGHAFTKNKVFTFTIVTIFIQLFFFFLLAFVVFTITGKTILGREAGQSVFYAEIIYFTGLVLTDKFLSLFYSQQAAGLCNKLLAVSAGLLLCSLMIIWQTDPRVIAENPVWVYSVFVFLPSVVLLISFFTRFNPSLQGLKRNEWISFVSFSSLVLVTNIIQFVAFRADYWFISYFNTETELGVYAQAAKFAQLLWIAPGIIAGLIVPALKNENQPMPDSLFIQLCRTSFYIHAAGSIVLAGLAFFIYLFFLPEIFFDGFRPLLIMMPGYLLFIFATLMAAFFSARRKLQVNLYGSLLCLLIIVSLDYWLIPKMGIAGAAIANLVAYSITAVYFIIRSQKLLRTGPGDFFIPRRKDFKLFSGSNTGNGDNPSV